MPLSCKKNYETDCMLDFYKNDEMIITPYKKGVKLLPKSESNIDNNLVYLSNVMQLPCNVYLLNKNSEYVAANKQMVDYFELDSIKEIRGKTVLDFCKSEECFPVIQNDKRVIDSKKPLLADEKIINHKGEKDNFLSIKIPIYADSHNVSGILGFSIWLSKQSLAESIVLFSKFGFTKLFDVTRKKMAIKAEINIDKMTLTDRQWEIINFVVRGFSASKIAQETGLSRRTVEHYIDAIKSKLHVNSKAKLIQKVIKLG